MKNGVVFQIKRWFIEPSRFHNKIRFLLSIPSYTYADSGILVTPSSYLRRDELHSKPDDEHSTPNDDHCLRVTMQAQPAQAQAKTKSAATAAQPAPRKVRFNVGKTYDVHCSTT